MDDAATAPASPARALWGWGALVALAWLVYELTAWPGLAVGVACLKFGWHDFRAAPWLRSRDPDPARGSALFWATLGLGLGKAALGGALVFALMGLVADLFPGPANGWSPFLGALAAMLGGGLLAALATLRALAVALPARHRLWLGTAAHRAREHDAWPPTAGGANWAGPLFLTVLIVGLWALVPAAFFGVRFLLGEIDRLLFGVRGPDAPAWVVAGTLLTLLAILLALPVGMVLARDLVVRRAVARSPADCWGGPAAEEPA